MNWLYFFLLAKLADGQVLVRRGRALVGLDPSAQDWTPDADDTRDLGADDLRWRDLFLSGDLTAAGGFRQCVQFGVTNVAAGDNAAVASSTPVQAQWGGAAAIAVGWVAPRAGSLTALSAALSAAAAGSDLIVGVHKNGTLLDATAIVTLASGTSDTKARGTFAKDALTFAAGDVLDVRVRTSTGWSATTADLGVAVEVEC